MLVFDCGVAGERASVFGKLVDLLVGRRLHGATVLIASDSLPLYDIESGGLRLANLVRSIGELGYPVVYVSFRKKAELPAFLQEKSARRRLEKEMLGWGVCRVLYGTRDATSFLAANGPRLHAAILSFPHVAQALLSVVRAQSPAACVMYDMVDNHGLRLRREAALAGDPTILREAEAMEARERQLFEAADVVIAVSGEEATEARRMSGCSKAITIGNAFSTPAEIPALAQRAGVVFLGGFWHPPNLDGIVWFCDAVWPLVLAQRPNAALTIGGSNMDARAKALGERPGVTIAGWVADLDVFYGQARVAVAPLRFGAGVKGKVGQAMVYGVPVVTTSVGSEGMSIRPGEDALVTDDPADMADAILRLLDDDELWLRVQKSALALVAATQSRDVMKSALAAVLQSVGAGSLCRSPRDA